MGDVCGLEPRCPDPVIRYLSRLWYASVGAHGPVEGYCVGCWGHLVTGGRSVAADHGLDYPRGGRDWDQAAPGGMAATVGTNCRCSTSHGALSSVCPRRATSPRRHATRRGAVDAHGNTVVRAL